MNSPALLRSALCASLALSFSSICVAQRTAAPASAVPASSTGSMFMVVLLLIAMVAGAWYLKRGGRLKGAPASELKVVSAVAVGARERIAIVEVAGKRLVVGITPQQISLLSETPAPAAFSASLKQAQETRNA
jgi:flagellar protein FliO/FliZ